MAPDSLIWQQPDPIDFGPMTEDEVANMFGRLLPKLELTLTFRKLTGSGGGPSERVNLRRESHRVILHNQCMIHDWIEKQQRRRRRVAAWEDLLGVKLFDDCGLHSVKRARSGLPSVEVHSARIARRSGPDGQELSQLIVQITQRRRGYYDAENQKAADEGTLKTSEPEKRDDPDFWFRGGSTLHIDLRDGRLRRFIRKRIDDDDRLERERRFRLGARGGLLAVDDKADEAEPFAMMHRG
jgi:hypothetical protein